MRLNAVEARVVGGLIEKELATPQQYPLTLNALVLACNQSSNRDPVVNYDDATVEAALASLREQHLVRFVHPSHGRSALRYRLVLDEVLGLDARHRALLAILLLRGPQTLGELRIRTGRLATFESLDDLEGELKWMGGREEPLVERLERRPGQKEERYSQRLVPEHERAAGPDEPPAERETDQHGPTTSSMTFAAPEQQPPARREPAEASIDELRAQVTELATAVTELREQIDALRESLGG